MKSPLYEWHVAAEAKLADFGGWDMPIEYPKGTSEGFPGGVLAEHVAVREGVGLFDVSHLGKISVVGTGSLNYLNTILTNDLNRVAPGSAQYNLICDSQGGVIDDLIVYQNSESDFFLIPNAANCAEVARVLAEHAPANIVIENIHHSYGVLALQGPLSVKVMQSLGVDLELDYMEFTQVQLPLHPELGSVIICRTGYTGEFGYELVPSWSSTLPLWKILVAQVNELGGRVCGLGARDTLRTEMGYPLHGHELSLDISPLQANAGWAVAMNKGDFLGRSALAAEKEQGLPRISRGLKSLDRGIPRAGMKVLVGGNEIGEVTSGTFSPTLKHGIALALISPSVKVGDHVEIDVRGRLSAAEVVKIPFVESRVR
ncbi:MAG: glycine cleavage system aminomethyltransferase GcvT [Actinomycetes bacterium]